MTPVVDVIRHSRGDRVAVVEEKKTRANGRASRRAILDAAFDVFAERGHRGTTMREIAQRVGMTQPGLLHHFSSKEELLLEVVRTREEVTARDVNAHFPQGAAPDLRQAIETLGRLNQRDPVEQLLLATLSAEAIPEDHPLHDFFVKLYDDNRKRLAGAIKAAQADGSVRADLDPTMLSREIIATLDGLRLQWLLDPKRVRLAEVLSSYAERVAEDLAPRSAMRRRTAARS